MSTSQLAALVGVSEDWIRQLCRAGIITKTAGKFDTAKSVAAIVDNYRQKQADLKGVKQKIEEEKLAKIKRENMEADGLLIERSVVVAEFRKAADAIKAMIRQKLENEYPLAVASLDVPQARIYGKRFGDDLLLEIQKPFKSIGI